MNTFAIPIVSLRGYQSSVVKLEADVQPSYLEGHLITSGAAKHLSGAARLERNACVDDY